MIKYRIIFRSCDAVYSAHGVSRPFNLDKRGIIKSCFLSLLESVGNFPHEIIVLGDRLSAEMEEFFTAFPIRLLNETLDNERSIARSLEIADSLPGDEWVYFCEDDYLHVPWAFGYIDDLIRNQAGIINGEFKSVPLFIHPADYPDRYQPQRRQPSHIFLSRHCHWRQISNTTFTFLAEVNTIKRYMDVFRKAAKNADDELLSREIYAFEPGKANDTLVSFLRRRFAGLKRPGRNTALCVSPIPGLSTHMHEGVMTPLLDWEKFTGKNQHD